MAFSFGIYSRINPDSKEEMDSVKEYHKLCSDKSIEIGGFPARYGWPSMTDEQKGSLYGESFIRLKELKAALDPNDLFNPGVF